MRPHEISERKENRFFFRPDKMHVSFYQMIGGFHTRGMNLESLGPLCSGTLCVQVGCGPGRCDDFSWNVSVPQGLCQHVADTFHTVVLNAGLWKIERFTTPAKGSELKESGAAFDRAGARDIIWRTTTPTQLDNLTSEELPAAMEEVVLIPQLKASSARWRVLDAFALTAPLLTHERPGDISAAFWDPYHFQPDVVRALNEALLADILRGCDLCNLPLDLNS